MGDGLAVRRRRQQSRKREGRRTTLDEANDHVDYRGGCADSEIALGTAEAGRYPLTPGLWRERVALKFLSVKGVPPVERVQIKCCQCDANMTAAVLKACEAEPETGYYLFRNKTRREETAPVEQVELTCPSGHMCRYACPVSRPVVERT